MRRSPRATAASKERDERHAGRSGLEGHEPGGHAAPGVVGVEADVHHGRLRNPAQRGHRDPTEAQQPHLEEAHARRGVDHRGEVHPLLQQVDAACRTAGLKHLVDVGHGRVEDHATTAEVVGRLDDERPLVVGGHPAAGRLSGQHLGRGHEIADLGQTRQRALGESPPPARVLEELIVAVVPGELATTALLLDLDRDDPVVDRPLEVDAAEVDDAAAEKPAREPEVRVELLLRGVDVDERRTLEEVARLAHVAVPSGLPTDEGRVLAAEHLLGEEPAVVRDDRVEARVRLALEHTRDELAVNAGRDDEVVAGEHGLVERLGPRLGDPARDEQVPGRAPVVLRHDHAPELQGSPDELRHELAVESDRHHGQRKRDRLARLLLDLRADAPNRLFVPGQSQDHCGILLVVTFPFVRLSNVGTLYY